MSTKVRLDDETGRVLRNAATRMGVSEQELLREAVARFLSLDSNINPIDVPVAKRMAQPTVPFMDVEPSIRLPAGVGSLDLLGRDR
jgi:hypothetical protein